MGTCVHLRDLSPYLLQGWYTHGRVTRIDSCRAYENAKGAGHVFSFTIAADDEVVDCVMFGAEAPKLAAKLESNKVYAFKNGRLIKKKPGYGSIESPYQLLIRDATSVTEVSSVEADSCQTSGQIDVGLIDFHELEQAIKANLRLDVLGIVVEHEPIATLFSRTTNSELEKSSLLLEDAISQRIGITLWNDQARAAEAMEAGKPVILLNLHGEINTEQSLVLTAQNATTIHNGEAYEEGKRLLEIFSTAKGDTPKTLLTSPLLQGPMTGTPIKLVSVISLAVMRRVETEYFRVVGVVTAVPYVPNFYMRCPVSKCGAKVVKTLHGRFECSRCKGATPSPNVGLTLVLDIQDYSGSAMVTVFNEAASTFLDQPLPTAKTLYQEHADEFQRVLAKRRFLHMEFRVSVSKNQDDIFSARCWSIRVLNEKLLTHILTGTREDNEKCIVTTS